MEYVKKPWGHEEHLVVTDQYVVKLIVIQDQHRLSLQFHREKHETIYVLVGHVFLEHDDSSRHLYPGDYSIIEPGTRHRFTALEGDVVILEALSGHAHGERQAGEVLLDHEGADERASPLDRVGVLGCWGLVDLGVHRRGVVAVYIGVTGTPRVDYPAYRSAGGEKRCGQHEDRGWRELKEAAETTRFIIHVKNFAIQCTICQAQSRDRHRAGTFQLYLSQ